MGFKIIGEIPNWMDLRDFLSEAFRNCQTEYQLNDLITKITLCIHGSAEGVIEGRRGLGIKISKKEEKELKKIFKNEI